MKTSSSQYDMMLTYLEQHGDLSKPSKDPGGRASNIQKWIELGQLLNSDSTGDTKSDVKWKKVWSDFKNNTKRKAARLHQAASGTGGGPACGAKLSDLEQRALAIVGTQAATGLIGVMEAGFAESSPPPQQQAEEHLQTVTEDIIFEDHFYTRRAPTPPVPPTQVIEVAARAETPRVETSSAYPPRPSPSGPSPSGETPRRRGNRRLRSAPMGRTRTHVDQAAQHFINADQGWRAFLMEQHRDIVRLRELEQETQRRWQNVCLEALGLLKDFIKKNDI